MKYAVSTLGFFAKSRIVGTSVAMLAAVLAVSACSPAMLANALTPTATLKKSGDVAYVNDGNARHRLDIYQPALPEFSARLRPVVVFFYGGAWQEGSRGDYLFLAEALTQRGYVVVVPDYRVYPEVKYPDFLRDGAAAVAWVSANIERYGGERSQVFLMGHSAGAHIAAMLALDHHYLDARKLPRASIRGLVGLAGPYDFLPLTEPNVIALFGSEPHLNLTQPIHYAELAKSAGRSLPASLLLHGDADRRVYPKNSINLATALRAAGAEVELELLPGVSHTGIIAKFTRMLRGDGAVVDRVDRFMRTHAS